MRRWGITAARLSVTTEASISTSTNTRICVNNQEERRANKVTVRKDQSIEGNRRNDRTAHGSWKREQRKGRRKKWMKQKIIKAKVKTCHDRTVPAADLGGRFVLRVFSFLFFLPLHSRGCLRKLLFRKSGAEGHLTRKLFPAVCNHPTLWRMIGGRQPALEYLTKPGSNSGVVK